jgi:hypothetical protein
LGRARLERNRLGQRLGRQVLDNLQRQQRRQQEEERSDNQERLGSRHSERLPQRHLQLEVPLAKARSDRLVRREGVRSGRAGRSVPNPLRRRLSERSEVVRQQLRRLLHRGPGSGKAHSGPSLRVDLERARLDSPLRVQHQRAVRLEVHHLLDSQRRLQLPHLLLSGPLRLSELLQRIRQHLLRPQEDLGKVRSDQHRRLSLHRLSGCQLSRTLATARTTHRARLGVLQPHRLQEDSEPSDNLQLQRRPPRRSGRQRLSEQQRLVPLHLLLHPAQQHLGERRQQRRRLGRRALSVSQLLAHLEVQHLVRRARLGSLPRARAQHHNRKLRPSDPLPLLLPQLRPVVSSLPSQRHQQPPVHRRMWPSPDLVKEERRSGITC